MPWLLRATTRRSLADMAENLSERNAHRFRADSVERAIEVLGGERWVFLILREAFFGVRRFGQFARNLGIARNVLIRRLDAIVDAGLFERVLYNEKGAWHEYRLTEAGREMYGPIIALMGWADDYLAGPEGPPLTLHHKTCGHDLRPLVVCSHCGGELDAREVEPRPGPGAVAPRRGRSAST
jgi:DNA-binding HxlR family transcriptional regulator